MPMTNPLPMNLAIHKAQPPAPGRPEANPERYVTLSWPVFEMIISLITNSTSAAAAPATSQLEPSPQPAEPAASGMGGKTDFATQYHVHLRGTFAKDGERALIITNGSEVTTVELQLVQFLTLLILACLARREAGLDAPIDVRGGAYLQRRRIYTEIMSLKAREPDLRGQAENLVPQDVYQARYGTRQRLKEGGLIQDLLESRPRSGYRISTLPQWIKITLFDEQGSQHWG